MTTTTDAFDRALARFSERAGAILRPARTEVESLGTVTGELDQVLRLTLSGAVPDEIIDGLVIGVQNSSTGAIDTLGTDPVSSVHGTISFLLAQHVYLGMLLQQELDRDAAEARDA